MLAASAEAAADLVRAAAGPSLPAAFGWQRLTLGRLAAQLTRAVGIAETVDADLLADDPRVGDTYLICSDGLTKMVTEEEIKKLAAGADLDGAARALVAAANEHGGRDNVTVILARVAPPPNL